MSTGIWENNEDLAASGYAGLPQEYIDKLYEEFKKYGYAAYKIGNYVIAQTTDIVVVTELFKRVVPIEYINTGKFKAILCTEKELIEIERLFRTTENTLNAVISNWSKYIDSNDSAVQRDKESQTSLLRQSKQRRKVQEVDR